MRGVDEVKSIASLVPLLVAAVVLGGAIGRI